MNPRNHTAGSHVASSSLSGPPSPNSIGRPRQPIHYLPRQSEGKLPVAHRLSCHPPNVANFTLACPQSVGSGHRETAVRRSAAARTPPHRISGRSKSCATAARARLVPDEHRVGVEAMTARAAAAVPASAQPEGNSAEQLCRSIADQVPQNPNIRGLASATYRAIRTQATELSLNTCASPRTSFQERIRTSASA
jgi:hypothetical protein